MQVVMVFPYSVRRLSGIGSVVSVISGDLVGRGERVVWITPRAAGDVLIYPAEGGGVIEFSASRYRVFGNVVLAFNTFRTIVSIQPPPSVVHVHAPHLQCVAAILAGKIRSAGTVATFHGRIP